MHTPNTIETLHDRGICVIIPTYNNCGTIADVINRTLAVCKDVIVVNDGSTDDTAHILSEYSDAITVVSYNRNGGKGTALKWGFRKALELGFSYAITLDADGQHFPEDIPTLLQANIENPGALILGQRKNLENMERSAGSKFANGFSNFWFCVQTFIPLKDTQTGYRLYPLKKLHGLAFLTSRYEAELELLVFSAWHGVKLVSQPINVYYPPKEERVSHFRPALDFTRISILNTILCILALVYALPLKLLRCIFTFLRTILSLGVYLVVTLLFMPPFLLFATLLYRDKHKRSYALHGLLFTTTRIILKGMPRVKCTIANTADEDFAKPSMIICNHQSHLDLMFMLALSRKVVVLTNDWVWNTPLYGYFIRMAEFYPISMGIDNLVPKLQELVDRGYTIAVYPEGTRSFTGKIGRFHKGAFELADILGLDILPLTQYGANHVMPKHGKYMRKGQIYLEIGKRVTPEEQQALGTIRERAQHFRKITQSNLVRLSNKLDQDA